MLECGSTISLPVLAEQPSAAAPHHAGIRRSKNGPRRAVVLTLVHVFFILHLAHWYWKGETLSPVEPSESMRTLEFGEVNAGAVFFALAILSTLIFGRFFCGWGCHLVAMQDLCGWFMKKLGVRPRAFRSRLLVYAPLVLALYMFIWPTLKRTAVAPVLEPVWPTVRTDLGVVPFPEQGFTNHLITEGFWDTFGPPLMAFPFLIVCGFAAVYFLGAKGFCTYGCPYGGLFGPADLIAPGKIRVDQSKCHHCGHCTAVCSSNVRVHEEIRDFGMVVSAGCMKCLDCVSVCPNGALSWGFGRPAALKRTSSPPPLAPSRPRRHYDTSRAEDLFLVLVFVGIFFAMRGAYGLIAMLFAVGIAGCGTFLAWKAWRTLRDRDARFSIWQLKRSGRIRPAGVVLLAVVGIAALLTAHTGYVNYHAWRADTIYERLAVPKARVLLPDQPGFDDATMDQARLALGHYATAGGVRDGGVGLLTPVENDLRAALLSLVLGDAPAAERILRRVVDRHGPSDELVADLGRILVLQGLPGEAASLYKAQLAAHPEFWAVREQLALLSFATTGAADESIAEAEAALARIPPDRFTRTAHARTRLTLGRLYAAVGRGDDALAQIVEGARVRPNDPVMHENVAAVVYQVRGDVRTAAAAMRRAVELEPSNNARRITLGSLLQQSGDIAGALQMFEEALRREPGNAELRETVDALRKSGAG